MSNIVNISSDNNKFNEFVQPLKTCLKTTISSEAQVEVVYGG